MERKIAIVFQQRDSKQVNWLCYTAMISFSLPFAQHQGGETTSAELSSKCKFNLSFLHACSDENF
jgi:hypothetical protein